MPSDGLNRRVSGVLLENRDGDYFIGHRGRLGGGAKGVGKEAFTAWYSDVKWHEVNDGGTQSDVRLLGSLDNPASLVRGLASFSHAAAAFKEFAAAQAVQNKATGGPGLAGKRLGSKPRKLKFKPEATGPFEIESKGPVTRNRTHGHVVKALKRWVDENLGAVQSGNPGNTDLIAKFGKGYYLYEVKTEADSQSVYMGIGQLFGYGLFWKPAKKILVLPYGRAGRIRKDLASLGIEVVGFKYIGKTITFHTN
jgi:hypothetical protein